MITNYIDLRLQIIMFTNNLRLQIIALIKSVYMPFPAYDLSSGIYTISAPNKIIILYY